MELDDFVPDYEPDETELPVSDPNHIRGSTKRFNKSRACPSCPGRFTNVRRHVLRAHLPWYFSPTTACWDCKIQFSQVSLLNIHINERHDNTPFGCVFSEDLHQSWVEHINGLLEAVGNSLQCKTLADLCHLANQKIHFEQNSYPTFQDVDLDLIKIFNSFNKKTTTEIDTRIMEPFPDYCLLHWKILSKLILLTDGKEQFATFIQPKPFPKPIVLKTINFIDSHFHLDMYCKKTSTTALPKYSWKGKENEYSINRLIANYCYPRNWPSSEERSCIRSDARLRFTYGIHPKIINTERTDLLDNWIDDLPSKLKTTKVVAVGECGLDDTARSTNISKQVRYFEKQLKLAKERELPVVIHCRGDSNVDRKCLDVMTRILPKKTKVHRHCFNAPVKTYMEWKGAFPNCKFGIAPFILMPEKYPNYRSVLCEMSLDDCILETDAPYLHPEEDSCGSPRLIEDITIRLANIFHCSSDDVAEVTTRNASELYNLK